MSKTTYPLIGIVAVSIVLLGGIYLYYQKTILVPEGPVLEKTPKTISAPEGKLPSKTEEAPETAAPSAAAVDISSLENLEKELNAELEGFSEDLSDLEEFENDTSLESLDTDLSGVSE